MNGFAWLFFGRCWACHRPNRDHTLVEMYDCTNQPIAIIIVEEADLDQ